MSSSGIEFFFLYGGASVLLISVGFFAMAYQADVLRKILAWNIIGSGVFLLFGALARRNESPEGPDPLPQAVIITGIIVAISSTAVALALTRHVRLDAMARQQKLQEEPNTGEAK